MGSERPSTETRMTGGENEEEEGQWSEEWGSCWGSSARHLGGDDSTMMAEVASDGWGREREAERGWELFSTPPQKTPWHTVNQSSCLDWFFSSFRFHSASYTFFLQNVSWCQHYAFYYLFSPFMTHIRYNCNCHISHPQTDTKWKCQSQQ